MEDKLGNEIQEGQLAIMLTAYQSRVSFTLVTVTGFTATLVRIVKHYVGGNSAGKCGAHKLIIMNNDNISIAKQYVDNRMFRRFEDDNGVIDDEDVAIQREEILEMLENYGQ